jgi:hypothetical protein
MAGLEMPDLSRMVAEPRCAGAENDPPRLDRERVAGVQVELHRVLQHGAGAPGLAHDKLNTADCLAVDDHSSHLSVRNERERIVLLEHGRQ